MHFLHLRDFKCARETEERGFLFVLHRIVCILGCVLLIYLLFRCYLAVSSALQDVRKFEHENSFPFFLYYLDREGFLSEVIVLLIMATEFFLYIHLSSRIDCQPSLRRSILYFVIVLMVHTAVYLHANTLILPNCPPYTAVDDVGLSYRFFANLMILPSALYFVMYLLRLWKCRKL